MAQLERTSSSIPIVFLFTAGAILAVMMSKTVKNDRMVIGILKALGYSNVQVFTHYIKYAVSIGVFGGILGSIIGTILSGIITNMYIQFFYIPMFRVQLYPWNIVISILLSSVFCSVAGLLGARNVLKISPAESMRPEPPKEGKRVLVEKINIIWRKVSFTWKMVTRNIFRDKRKFVFISFAGAATLAMMIMSMWMTEMTQRMFNDYYGGFLKMDYTVEFTRPLSEESVMEMRHVVENSYIEPKIEFPFEVSRGKESKIVNIVGLEKDTEFYGFQDTDMNKVELTDKGVLLSSNLEKILDAQPGDYVRVKNYLPGRDDEYVKVTGIVQQALGINLYMEINHMQEKLTGKNTISGAYIKTDRNISSDLENAKNITTIQSIKEMKEIFYEYVDLTIVSIVFMFVFSGILGFVIIYSMTVMSINERRAEFSSLRVLGFTKNEIFGIVLKENALMTLVGLVYGTPMGLALVKSMGETFSTDLYTFDSPVTQFHIIMGIVFTIICLTLAQLITYRKIKHLNFIEALKSRTT